MSARPRISLVGGGTRSGKSAFALELARSRGKRRVFIATAQAFDAEMRERIAAHQGERGTEFDTLEAPHELARTLHALSEPDVVLIDCITLWLSNVVLAGASEGQMAAQVAELCQVLERRRFHTVLVTNEVGMGIVPESALGRLFRDIAGRTNQRLASLSDELYWAMLGSVLRLRPEPLSVAHPRSPA